MEFMGSCTQPKCLLREEEVDSRFLAELIVKVLAGEDVSELMADKTPIQPYQRCVECVLKIQGGQGPLPSIDEIEHLLEAGRWSHRRQRRREMREQHDREC